MKRGVSFIIIVSLLLSFFSAGLAAVKPSVEAHCTDHGSITVSNLEREEKAVSVKKSGGSSVLVEGKWREMSNGLYKFTSEDMAVVDISGGSYSIKVGKSSYYAKCPAFKFSCKMINLTINGCYKRNETFTAKYTAYSFRYDKQNEFRFEKPFMLTYEASSIVDGRRKEFTHAPSILSPEFKVINVSRIKRVGSNTYTLRWITPLNISRFMIKFDDCEVARYSFFDTFECSERPSCVSDSECLLSERCDDNRCIPVSCGPCQVVSNNSCLDLECCSSIDCSPEESCVNSECEKLTCEFDEQAVNHSCEALECAEDEYVSNHTCSKLNCGETEVAVNHACREVECGNDEFLVNKSCQKLSCKFWQKPFSHKCVSWFSSWFRNT